MKSAEKVLYSMEEWQNDWKAHALFCAYDGEPGEEYVIEFWKRAIQALFDEHVQGLALTLDELKVITRRKGRSPTGLEEIVKELVKRGELFDNHEIIEKVKDKKAQKSWKTWAGRKISKFWTCSSNQFSFISCKKLEKTLENIRKFCKEKQRNLFVRHEVKEIFGLSETDLEIVFNYLELQDGLVVKMQEIGDEMYQFVKFKVFEGDEMEIYPQDTVLFNLQKTSDKIEEKCNELIINSNDLKLKIIQELKKNKTTAKQFLIMKKFVDKKIEQLQAAKLNIEQQKISIEQAVINKTIVETMKKSNQVMKESLLDLGEVDKVIQDSKDLIDQQNEIAEGLAGPIHEIDQDLDEEFESLQVLEIPEVPDYDIIKKKRKISEDVEKESEIQENQSFYRFEDRNEKRVKFLEML
jgi:hypothetical protein